MSRARYAVLPLVFGLFAGTACGWDLTGLDNICFHSEGCDNGGGYWDLDLPLSLNGLVTAAPTGLPLGGVTVRIEAPARGWNETVLTDSTGRYFSQGLPKPVAGDCAGLSVSFSREGYQAVRVTEFPGLICGGGYPQLNASLTPTP